MGNAQVSYVPWKTRDSGKAFKYHFAKTGIQLQSPQRTTVSLKQAGFPQLFSSPPPQIIQVEFTISPRPPSQIPPCVLLLQQHFVLYTSDKLDLKLQQRNNVSSSTEVWPSTLLLLDYTVAIIPMKWTSYKCCL